MPAVVKIFVVAGLAVVTVAVNVQVPDVLRTWKVLPSAALKVTVSPTAIVTLAGWGPLVASVTTWVVPAWAGVAVTRTPSSTVRTAAAARFTPPSCHPYGGDMLIGAHVGKDGETDLAQVAKERDCDVVQLFLGDPQSWKAPTVTEVALDIPFFVHSPYVVNVASANNKIRIPSRKILDQHAQAAAKVGAQGLIVHGGHTTAKDSDTLGLENWVKTFERMERPLPILIENTAGGDHAMARRCDAIARLWDAVGGFDNVGFCLDTCHAWAGGEELATAVERILAITGRIDLVHCNNSRDDFDSGADRHANLTAGSIDADVLVEIVRAAGCPVVVETPSEGQADDIALLKSRLA